MDEKQTITLDEYTGTYAKQLDTIARVINEHPEHFADSEVRPDELAMTIAIVDNTIQRSLSNNLAEMEALRKERDDAKKNLEFQKGMTQQYYLQLSSQNTAIQQHAYNAQQEQAKTLMSFEDIGRLIADM